MRRDCVIWRQCLDSICRRPTIWQRGQHVSCRQDVSRHQFVQWWVVPVRCQREETDRRPDATGDVGRLRCRVQGQACYVEQLHVGGGWPAPHLFHSAVRTAGVARQQLARDTTGAASWQPAHGAVDECRRYRRDDDDNDGTSRVAGIVEDRVDVVEAVRVDAACQPVHERRKHVRQTVGDGLTTTNVTLN